MRAGTHAHCKQQQRQCGGQDHLPSVQDQLKGALEEGWKEEATVKDRLLIVLFTYSLMIAIVIGVVVLASQADALSFDADHPRHTTGHHSTRHYIAWAAAPEKAHQSAPVPEPDGLLLFACGCMMVSAYFYGRSHGK